MRKYAVRIVRPTTRKLFLGGYRHRVTGVVYHNATAQTLPLRSQLDRSSYTYTRSTQTCAERHFMQQTSETTSTQMTGVGVYIPVLTDKLLEPRRYVTADEFLKIRASQVHVIFSYHVLTPQSSLSSPWHFFENPGCGFIFHEMPWRPLLYHA